MNDIRVSTNAPNAQNLLEVASRRKKLLGTIISYYTGLVHADLDDALWNTPYAFKKDLTFKDLRAASPIQTFWEDFQKILNVAGFPMNTVGEIVDFFEWDERDLTPLKGVDGKIETDHILGALEDLEKRLFSGT